MTDIVVLQSVRIIDQTGEEPDVFVRQIQDATGAYGLQFQQGSATYEFRPEFARAIANAMDDLLDILPEPVDPIV